MIRHCAGSHRCRACDGPLEVWVAAVDPQSGERFSIERCRACGLGHTHPQPDTLDPYYGREYYGLRHGPTDRFCSWRRCRFLARVAPRPGRLLDIGCGDGAFLLAAAARGWSTAGTEIGPAAEAAAARGVRVESGLDAFGEDEAFDAITLWHTLEHFRDPIPVLSRVSRLITGGGTVIVAVPNVGGLQASVFGERWFGLDVPRHLVHFTPAALTHAARRSGLQIVRWGHQELEYDVFGWIQSALNVMLPTPNQLFVALTRKPSGLRASRRALNLAAGALLAAPAGALTLASTALRRGGTVIAVMRRVTRET